VRLTIVAIAAAGGLAGGSLWILGTPLLIRLFFRHLEPALVIWAGVTVFTQLFVATAKACSQGTDDLRGANRLIVLEELTFLPAFFALLAGGVHGHAAIIAGLLIADISTAAAGWMRLTKRGFFRDVRPPSLALARDIGGYGLRAQIGGLFLLLNLRLDFALLGALAGPAVLGTYAIASKFAELLKLPPMALTYVLYPRYSRDGAEAAARHARTLIPKAGAFTAVAALPLALAASVLLPLIYGEAFRPSIFPTYILLLGLAGEGVAGVITPFLYGIGRPGLNSLAMGVGVVVTAVLDFTLIPRLEATGAALASSAAYLTTTLLLWLFFLTLNRQAESKATRVTALGGSP